MTDLPTITVANPNAELSDAAITALATLLVDVVEREQREKENASPPELDGEA